MTIYFPDISSLQAGISLNGAVAVLAKVTEGTTYANPDYGSAKARAAAAGTFFCAYHLLHEGNAVAQGQFAHNRAAATPLMVDFEPVTGSNPSIADVVAFVTEYRANGGTCYLVYLPEWYWSDLGKPALTALSDLGLMIVSSNYSSFAAGAGWLAYGGLTPVVWQYTDSGTLNGVTVDLNAYQGTLADFKSLVTTGALGGSSPVLVQGDTGPAVVTLQTRLDVWGAKLAVDGAFGAGTLAALRAFQKARKLTVDGIAGPKTWAALDAVPPSPKPVPGGYPAPGGLAVKTVSLAVEWDAVTPAAGELVTGYTVRAVGMNGEVYVTEVTTANSAVLAGLVQGWTYTVEVWANGGAIAPAGASLKVTV